MLFPIACYTCGKIIEDKKEEYDKLIKDKNNGVNKYKNDSQIEVFKKLKINRYCCKKFFMTNVSIYDFIKEY